MESEKRLRFQNQTAFCILNPYPHLGRRSLTDSAVPMDTPMSHSYIGVWLLINSSVRVSAFCLIPKCHLPLDSPSLDVAIELNGWNKIFSEKKNWRQLLNTYHLFPLVPWAQCVKLGLPTRLQSPVGPDSQASCLFPNQTLCPFLKSSHSKYLICKYIDRFLNSLVVTSSVGI